MTIGVTSSAIPRRQALLSTKVLITWGAMLAAWVAHRLAPERVSELLPLLIFAISRLFLWPAFPGVGRSVFRIFVAGQLLLLVPPAAGYVSLIAYSLWAIITFGALAFLVINDFAHVYWRLRRPRTESSETQ